MTTHTLDMVGNPENWFSHITAQIIMMFVFQCFTLKGEKQEVTRLARSPDKSHIAVGYNDGTICVFDLITGEKTITFSGHKSAVTALKYDQKGLRLVSGGKVGGNG